MRTLASIPIVSNLSAFLTRIFREERSHHDAFGVASNIPFFLAKWSNNGILHVRTLLIHDGYETDVLNLLVEEKIIFFCLNCLLSLYALSSSWFSSSTDYF